MSTNSLIPDIIFTNKIKIDVNAVCIYIYKCNYLFFFIQLKNATLATPQVFILNWIQLMHDKESVFLFFNSGWRSTLTTWADSFRHNLWIQKYITSERVHRSLDYYSIRASSFSLELFIPKKRRFKSY